MDPQACLKLILECTDKVRASEHCEDLACWLRRGGFRPVVLTGTRYWPGTGTGYRLLSPAYDTDNRWMFARYDGKGCRVESWILPEQIVKAE